MSKRMNWPLMKRREWSIALLAFVTGIVGGVTLGCGSETPPPPAITSVSPQELMQLMQAHAEIVVLDVRTPEEYAEGHIAGAVNIPYTEVASRLNELAKYRDKHVIVCCWAGGRAAIAKQILSDAGFTSLLDLRGHMAEWERLGYPVEGKTN